MGGEKLDEEEVGVPEPVVWIVDSEHWQRACLRAELIERGYDAVGFETIRDALTSLAAGSPRPQVVIIDLKGQDVGAGQPSIFVPQGVALVGIAGAIEIAQRHVHELPWSSLLRRPISLGAVADVVDRHVRGYGASAER
jgi:hypothetical protein